MSELIERITRLHAQEAAAARKVMSPDELPSSYGSITPQWLTAILCRDHPGAEVVALTLDRPDDGFSNRRRIFVEYNRAGRDAGLPASVFCKACHDLVSRIIFAVTGVGQTEVDFYNHLRDRLTIETTSAYFARCDPVTMNTIIVMRDERDATFFDTDTDIDRALIGDMVARLARFHATFQAVENLAVARRYLGNYADQWSDFVQLGVEARCRQGLAAAEALVPHAVSARGDALWRATEASAARHRDASAVVIHADCHLKNWYLSGSGQIGLNDWQSVSFGNGPRDLSYLLTSALTVEQRRAWERELVADYAKTLHAAGGPLLSVDGVWEDYRGQIFTCLATWTFQFCQPDGQASVQPHKTKETYIRRMAQAIDDLGSIDALLQERRR